MAETFTVNLSDELGNELVKVRDDHNRSFPTNQLTTAQKGRDIIRDFLTISAQNRIDEVERIRLRQAFNAATTEDQERVKRILNL